MIVRAPRVRSVTPTDPPQSTLVVFAISLLPLAAGVPCDCHRPDTTLQAQSAAAERLEDLEILAGTIPATGRGVRITISDPEGSVSTSMVLGVIQELRNAGAEVLQIGPVRVVASTSITTGNCNRSSSTLPKLRDIPRFMMMYYGGHDVKNANYIF